MAGNEVIVSGHRLIMPDQTEVRCALGRGGIGFKSGEGDGITPIGTWPLRRLFYRPDRMDLPITQLRSDPIQPDDGWCDAPEDSNYNRLVTLPYPVSCETMWREDALYDLVVVLGHNDDPVIPGAGSAIFMHLARPDFSPTEGCVALAQQDLLHLLTQCGPDTTIRIES